MVKLQPIRLLVLSAASLLLGTGCVHIDNFARFEGPSEIEMPPLLPLTVLVNDTYDFDVVSIPLLITSITNAPPFTLTLSAQDDSGQYRQLLLEECLIAYADSNRSPESKLPLVVPFEMAERASKAKIEFEQGIPLEQDFGLHVRGRYILMDGTELPFAGKCDFKMRKTRGLRSSLVVLNGV